MIEFAVKYGIPLLVLLLAAQSSFFQSWRFFVALVFAVYPGLWGYPLVYDFSKAFIPKEFAELSAVAATLIPALVYFFTVFQFSGKLTTHGGGGYHLPQNRNPLTWLVNGLSGLVLSGFAGYLLCLSPLHGKITSDMEFAGTCVSRLNILTGFVDAFSLQGVHPSSRREMLLKRIPSPVKKNAVEEKKPVTKVEEKITPAENLPQIARLEGEEFGVSAAGDNGPSASAPENIGQQ